VLALPGDRRKPNRRCEILGKKFWSSTFNAIPRGTLISPALFFFLLAQMALAKRKAHADLPLSGKATKNKHESERAPKRQKNGAAVGEPQAAGKENRSAATIAATSILKSEGKAFPRGGAPVLTPLEHRQIQRQAEHDVLFEQSGNQKSTVRDENDEDSDAQPTVKEPKKRRKTSSKKDASATTSDEPNIKIECLNFKVSLS
jgi:rRNA biogenesis protein RRP5